MISIEMELNALMLIESIAWYVTLIRLISWIGTYVALFRWCELIWYIYSRKYNMTCFLEFLNLRMYDSYMYICDMDKWWNDCNLNMLVLILIMLMFSIIWLESWKYRWVLSISVWFVYFVYLFRWITKP